MKPSHFEKCLETAIRNKDKILVKGAPGVGKSQIVESVVKRMGYDLILMHPVISDEVDFKGIPWKIEGEDMATFLPFDDLHRLISADKPTVCFIDDVGQARASVQASAMQLLEARRLGGKSVSDHVVFVAASNRKTDKSGVSGVIEALKSRFTTIISLDPDVRDWSRWANINKVFSPLVQFCNFRPKLLFDFHPTSELTNSPCPRTVYHVGRIMEGGYPKEVEFELVEGAAGKGFASEFLGFMDVFKKLPNPQRILVDPDNAPIPNPDEPNVLFAICGALADMATANTFGNIMRYVERLPVEFGTMLIVSAAQRHGEEVEHTDAFQKWFIDHQDVVF